MLRLRRLVGDIRRASRSGRGGRLGETFRARRRNRATRRGWCRSPNGTSVVHGTTSANHRRTESAATLRPNSNRNRLRTCSEHSNAGTDADGRRHDGHDPRSHEANLLVRPRPRRPETAETSTTFGQWAHPHPEPHPPPARGAGVDGASLPPPTDANTDRSRTAFGCPSGQVAGSLAADIDRRSSKVASQVLQRNSYTGMVDSVDLVD